MKAEFFNSLLAGDSLWSEQRTIAPDDHGLFNILLGEEIAMPTTLFNGPNRWLGISIQDEMEMAPRVRLVSTPFAFKAARADRATLAYGVTGGPGIAWTSDPNSVQLPWGSWTQIAVCSVETPGPGYILVNATCDISVTANDSVDSSGREYRTAVRIDEDLESSGLWCVAGLSYLPSEPGSGDPNRDYTLNTPAAVQRVYTKDTADTYAFYLFGTRLGEDCDAYAHRVTMTAIFFPTAYQVED